MIEKMSPILPFSALVPTARPIQKEGLFFQSLLKSACIDQYFQDKTSAFNSEPHSVTSCSPMKNEAVVTPLAVVAAIGSEQEEAQNYTLNEASPPRAVNLATSAVRTTARLHRCLPRGRRVNR